MGDKENNQAMGDAILVNDMPTGPVIPINSIFSKYFKRYWNYEEHNLLLLHQTKGGN